jgi:hypothetical protein
MPYFFVPQKKNKNRPAQALTTNIDAFENKKTD